MTEDQLNRLNGRIDGIGRVLVRLIADLEMREQLDGQRFCKGLHEMADGRSKHLQHQISAQVIHEIAHELEAARSHRQQVSPT